MEIRSLSAIQSYGSARPATMPAPNDAGLGTQGNDVFRNFVDTVQIGENTAINAMTGSADPHALVQALAQTELAVETAVVVRNKVVEAYQEILRMPV